MTSILEIFPLRHPPRPAFLHRPRLRMLLAGLRDLAARLLRGRARPETVADALHAAARIALHRIAEELDPRCVDGCATERGLALATAAGSDLEACAGGLARAGLRLGRRRLRSRRGVRRS